ncbi:hypothetical protein ACIRJS_04420 [Streptomyces sp. NPDC102340]|uniref:hypothetical protein n=1 Tax=unclassified Streptomyces TaxID=2593676 RepID=UPI0038022800
MSFFARASWPGDHRDEVVAGALAAAVIIVLGYASGIGATADQTTTGSAPPTVGAPASPSAPGSPAPTPTESPTSDSGGDGTGDTGALPVGGIPGGGAGGAGEAAGDHDGHGNSSGLPDDDSGHSGHTSPTSPTSPDPSSPPSATPSPSPSSPSTSPSCADGEVHLVQPLLKGALTPVTGLLDGLTNGGDGASSSASGTEPESGSASDEEIAPCVGLASDPALLTELTP